MMVRGGWRRGEEGEVDPYPLHNDAAERVAEKDEGLGGSAAELREAHRRQQQGSGTGGDGAPCTRLSAARFATRVWA